MSRTYVRIENTTRQSLLASRAELANTVWARMRGLLGRSALASGEALVIQPCQGVHTLLMRFPIDVLHVDAAGRVCRTVEALRPNRLGPLVWRSRYVVELPAGAIRASGTQVGDRIVISEPSPLLMGLGAGAGRGDRT